MEKVKVIILPEIHELSQVANPIFLPIISQGVRRVKDMDPNAKVLNFTEGTKKDDFFYQLDAESINFMDIVESDASDGEEDNCINYFHKLLFVIKNYAEVMKEFREKGMDPNRQLSMFSNESGDKVPYSPRYIDNLLIDLYKFDRFIDPVEDSRIEQVTDQFYLIIRSAIAPLFNMNMGVGEAIGRYEHALSIFLNSAKSAFMRKNCSQNIGHCFDKLIAAHSSRDIFGTIDKLRIDLRSYRDNKMMAKIIHTLQTSTDVKLVVMIVGAAHYSNLKRMVLENPMLEFEKAQKILDYLGFEELSTEPDDSKILKIMEKILINTAFFVTSGVSTEDTLPPVPLQSSIPMDNSSLSLSPPVPPPVLPVSPVPSQSSTPIGSSSPSLSQAPPSAVWQTVSPTTRKRILPFSTEVRIVGLSPEMNGRMATTLPSLKRDNRGKVVGQNVLIRASENDIIGDIQMGLNFENMELLDQLGGRRKRKTKANRKLKRRKSRKHKNKKRNKTNTRL